MILIAPAASGSACSASSSRRGPPRWDRDGRPKRATCGSESTLVDPARATPLPSRTSPSQTWLSHSGAFAHSAGRSSTPAIAGPYAGTPRGARSRSPPRPHPPTRRPPLAHFRKRPPGGALAVYSLSEYNLASAGARMDEDERGAAATVAGRACGGVAPAHRAGGPLGGASARGRRRARSRRLRRARPGPVRPRRAREAASSAEGAEHGSRGGRRARERAGAVLASDPRADERRRRRGATLHRRTAALGQAA